MSRITQVATYIQYSIAGQEDKDPTLDLSKEAHDLIQSIIWSTVIAPPTSSTTLQLTHKEFLFTISTLPWKLSEEYEIVDELEPGLFQKVGMSPFKLRFWLEVLPTAPCSSENNKA
ncbi:hypothetical protein BGW38_002293 [Lunasporangiospora selenospora]|uniref:Uncharacterized protein n=1 Tax=Lunasporangiospora selenospora TaxID=979761 RepID=A0A9P6KD03_9FUNG|nr:hypothetical protein BGW38_002293 [Lunasporangiospora selenospora]